MPILVPTVEVWLIARASQTRISCQSRAGLNDGLFSETMDLCDFPSVLSAVPIAQS